MVRVFINGFGRIGRSVLRAWASGAWAGAGIEIVGINDVAAAESCAYLFEYDSVFGPWRGSVGLGDGALIVDGRAIALSHSADLRALDLNGVDVVMECTGRADSAETARRGLEAGAGRVLISGPSQAAEAVVVLGANDAALAPALAAGKRVISNASCTTNALAPLLRCLDHGFGIESGWMTTIHCYTGSQPTIDAARGDPARSRAAALSMVPTTTSASRLVDLVLPELAGRVEGAAVRVPTASVSAVDLVLLLRERADAAAVNTHLRGAGGVIGWTDRPLVSSDLRARPESVVMALAETRVTQAGLLRVFGWYDNEWGFSNRMLDMAARMGM